MFESYDNLMLKMFTKNGKNLDYLFKEAGVGAIAITKKIMPNPPKFKNNPGSGS